MAKEKKQLKLQLLKSEGSSGCSLCALKAYDKSGKVNKFKKYLDKEGGATIMAQMEFIKETYGSDYHNVASMGYTLNDLAKKLKTGRVIVILDWHTVYMDIDNGIVYSNVDWDDFYDWVLYYFIMP